MFVPWNVTAAGFSMGEGFAKEFEEKFPKCWEWHQRLMSREAVKRTFEIKAEASAKH